MLVYLGKLKSINFAAPEVNFQRRLWIRAENFFESSLLV